MGGMVQPAAHSLRWVATEPWQEFQEGEKASISHAKDMGSASKQFFFREIIMRTISISSRILTVVGISLAALCLTLGVTPKTIAGSDDLASWKFTPIDVPGAVLTTARDMNAVGQLVGEYWKEGSLESPEEYRGFLLSKGVFTPILVGDYNDARGINLTGEIVGYFEKVTPQDEYHGYLLRKGKVTQIDYPGTDPGYTVPEAINDLGAIVGWYGVVDEKGTYTEHGFLLYHGVYNPIDYPGAFATNARGINLQGDIVGIYTNNSDPESWWKGPWHGFLRKRDGAFTTINGPDSPDGNCNGINLLRQIVGEYTGVDGNRYGFLLSGGKYASFGIPGANITRLWKITPLGQHIVGFYDDQDGSPHGFLLSRMPSH